jgi:predicted HTH domain antitoxin
MAEKDNVDDGRAGHAADSTIFGALVTAPRIVGMETVNVSGLKNNPSEALRKSRPEVVLVLNRDRPDALMLGVELAGGLDAKGVRPALATALFRDGNLSLARAARLAEMPLSEFITHLSRLGIPAVDLNAQETAADLDTLDAWLASS